VVVLLVVFLTGAVSAEDYPLEQGKYLDIVKNFADTVIEHGRDGYGPVHSPLFVETLNVRTKEPYHYLLAESYVTNEGLNYGHPTDQIISCFHISQQLHITLKELSKLTGDHKYLDAATDAANYGVNNLQHENGLFWMGQHTCYDLKTEKHVGLSGKVVNGYASTMHEMGGYLPDLRFLYEQNPEAVEKYIGEYWAMSISDWTNLNWGRHLSYTYSAMKYQGGEPFKKVYLIDEDYPLPYFSGESVDFYRQSDMIYMAYFYYRMTGDKNALKAGRSLVNYYMRMKFDNGLGPSRYCWDNVKGIESVETVDVYGFRYKNSLFLFFKLAEMFEDDPEIRDELFEWGRGEVIPFSRHMDQVYTNRGRFWALAYAYRQTKDPEIWGALRRIISGFELGDIGSSPGVNMNLKFDSYEVYSPPSKTGGIEDKWNNEEEYIIHGLIEIYKATGEEEYLQLAAYTADEMISELLYYGFFVRQPRGLYARLGDGKYLALLHLEAAMQGKELEYDSVMYRDLFYRSSHKGYGKDWGNVQYYWILDDSSQYCGDENCDNDENCELCPEDCGNCEEPPEEPQNVICNNMELLMNFNTNSINQIDESGNGNTGMVYGAVFDSSGRLGGSYDFDGVNDSIVIPDSGSLDIVDQISLVAWIKADSVDEDYQYFLMKGSSTASERAYGLMLEGDDLKFFVDGYDYTSDDANNLVVEDRIEVGRWYHVAGTYDGAQLVLYLDGIEVGRSSYSGLILTNSDDVYVSCRGGADSVGFCFDGMIDEVGIWGGALSSDEVAEISSGATCEDRAIDVNDIYLAIERWKAGEISLDEVLELIGEWIG